MGHYATLLERIPDNWSGKIYIQGIPAVKKFGCCPCAPSPLLLRRCLTTTWSLVILVLEKGQIKPKASSRDFAWPLTMLEFRLLRPESLTMCSPERVRLWHWLYRYWTGFYKGLLYPILLEHLPQKSPKDTIEHFLHVFFFFKKVISLGNLPFSHQDVAEGPPFNNQLKKKGSGCACNASDIQSLSPQTLPPLWKICRWDWAGLPWT